ncbi:hypothetical protein ABVB69_31960 [Streptomyces sp. NPDC000349]|uniref:hypothetical protein n=1 Tax=unclassified Streptomyces TaxID=2593676 RepID=UPI0027825A49|nr:hypothetical protein [Streptomyces sp. DSM 40167]MDQ0405887.1 hypothetical protein [Streptomyces sp. DSM 40167]
MSIRTTRARLGLRLQRLRQRGRLLLRRLRRTRGTLSTSSYAYLGSGSTDATKHKLRYHGAKYHFDLYRTASGQYRFYHNDAWHYASYTSNTCD